MKTKGHKAFASLRAGVVATVAAALVVTPLAVAHSAEAPTFGKACTTEGVSTGQSTTSLICQTGSNGKLTWQRVRLGSTNATTPARSEAKVLSPLVFIFILALEGLLLFTIL